MISVVIPHYKGTELLFTSLKRNLPFLNGCEVIVVNDFPPTSLKEQMKTAFPAVKIIENAVNLGFAGAADTGIKAAQNRYVLLLNNDVILKDDSYHRALTRFKENDELFAVSFAQKEKNNEIVGRNRIYWSNGYFQHAKDNAAIHGINGWAEGGSMILDKQKYEILGGFDRLFSPFYWEDIDLSYRAWKSGFTVYFDPEIAVEHHHESTIGVYFKRSNIDSVAYRNQLITIWKNISDSSLLGQHAIYLLNNIALSPFRDRGLQAKSFFMALLLLPKIIQNRFSQKKLWKKTDKELFRQFGKI